MPHDAGSAAAPVAANCKPVGCAGLVQPSTRHEHVCTVSNYVVHVTHIVAERVRTSAHRQYVNFVTVSSCRQALRPHVQIRVGQLEWSATPILSQLPGLTGPLVLLRRAANSNGPELGHYRHGLPAGDHHDAARATSHPRTRVIRATRT